MGRLLGKTALITAAAAGIGRATALAYAAEGAHVIAVDIDGTGLVELCASPGHITAEVVDVTVTQAVQALLARAPFIDVLVNAVGIVHDGTILECSEVDWLKSLNINLTSMYQMVRTFLPSMIEQKSGSIVNIASVASSLKGVPSRCAYSATKAGVIGLTKSVATDFVSHGIRCNAICPGTIETPSLSQRLQSSGDEAAARKAFVARQPLGRFGTSAEVAALAVYLGSDEASFTTGATHVIDGGWTT